MKRFTFGLTLLAVAGLGYLFGSGRDAAESSALSLPTAPPAGAVATGEELFSEPRPPAESPTGRSSPPPPVHVLPYPVEGPLDTWEKKVARCQEIAIEIGPSRWMQDIYNDVYIGRLESAHYFMEQRESAAPADLALLGSMVQSLKGLEQEMRTLVRNEMYRCIEECDYPPQAAGEPPPPLSRDSYLSVRIPLLNGGGSLIECRKGKVPQIAEKLETSRRIYLEAEDLARRLGWEFETQVAQFENGAFGARRTVHRSGRTTAD
jgi:hypothetical protein